MLSRVVITARHVGARATIRTPAAASAARWVSQKGPTPPTERPSKQTDPWLMPLDDPGLAAAQNPSLAELDEELSMPQPIDRTGEDEETLRARLVYQTRKRGTLETDLILGTFAKEYLGKMSVEELRQFDKVGLNVLIEQAGGLSILCLSRPSFSTSLTGISTTGPLARSSRPSVGSVRPCWPSQYQLVFCYRFIADAFCSPDRLKQHAKNEGRQVRVMPELGKRGGL